jgi:septum site-determining protein MinD
VEKGDMLSIADVEEILGLKVIGVIPESPEVLQSSNAGVPVILDDASDAGQAYADAVARLSGEERPMRFVDATKKGFLARIFGS